MKLGYIDPNRFTKNVMQLATPQEVAKYIASYEVHPLHYRLMLCLSLIKQKLGRASNKDLEIINQTGLNKIYFLLGQLKRTNVFKYQRGLELYEQKKSA